MEESIDFNLAYVNAGHPRPKQCQCQKFFFFSVNKISQCLMHHKEAKRVYAAS